MTASRRTCAVVVLSALAVWGGVLATPASSAPATSASPPSCSNTAKNTNCVHAPSEGITALPSPAVKDTYNAKHRKRVLEFSGTITPEYSACPPGDGVPIQDIPCTFDGLSVGARVYMTNGSPAVGVGGDADGESEVPGDCEVFTCQHVEITMPYDYYGPSTVILSYGVGNLIDGPNGPGAFSSSDYENTIKVPADPTSHAVYVLKGKKVLTTTSKTRALSLAGKGGVPRHDVGGVVVFIDGAGSGEIKQGPYFGDSEGTLEVIKGTTLHLIKEAGSRGTYNVTPVAYYSTKVGLTGDLLHATLGEKKVHVARKMSLRKAGVPTNATAVIIAVTSAHGSFTAGGVQIAKSEDASYAMVPLAHGGILRTNATHGAKVLVAGYTAPIQRIDDGSTLTTSYPQDLPGLLNLPTLY